MVSTRAAKRRRLAIEPLEIDSDSETDYLPPVIRRDPITFPNARDAVSDDSDIEVVDSAEENEKEEIPTGRVLHAAVKAKDIELIKKTLDSGVDVDEPGEKYKTALHVAVEQEFLPAVKLLVEYGANVAAKVVNTSKRLAYLINLSTPLHTAVSKNRLDLVKLLLTTELNVSALKKNRDAVLKHAVKRKNYKVIDSLVGYSKLISSNDSISKTMQSFSLQQLTKMGYSEGERMILFGKPSVVDTLDSSGKNLLWIALQNESIEMIKYLLDCNADINVLIEDDPCQPKETLLHAAIRKGKKKIFNFLLDTGHCDVNIEASNGETALQLAAKMNNLAVVKKLINKNAEFRIEGNGYSPYHSAVENNAIEVTRYFLKTVKVDVNLEMKNGRNALQQAMPHLKIPMVKLLLEYGIDVNHKDRTKTLNSTALARAVMFYNGEIADLLMTNGADVNTASVFDTALAQGNSYIIKRLLDHGVDINNINVVKVVDSDVFKRHLSKLKAAKFFICEKFRDLVDNEFYRKCKKEVRMMKERKINDTTVCYYDLLVKNVNQLTKMANNVDIVQAINLEELKTEFPSYADILVCNFRRGQTRYKLMEVAEETLKFLFTQLPYDCVNHILGFLSNKDLLIYSSKSTKR